MYKLLIMIQLGSSHSSQLASYDSQVDADLAFLLIKKTNNAYNFTVTKLYKE